MAVFSKSCVFLTIILCLHSSSERGVDPKYTEYPHLGHNCWEEAYATPELWDWLLKQKRK
jgi:hypothetical protein